MTAVQQSITSIALGYKGQRETKNNGGFVDPVFQKKMEAMGWSKGEAWCAYFAKLVWFEMYDHTPWGIDVERNFSPSAVRTFQVAQKRCDFKTSKIAVVGSVVIFQQGKGWTGHAGIVIEVGNGFITTVEGNTNTDGSREGIEVCVKKRLLDQPFNPNGLNILGFILPPNT